MKVECCSEMVVHLCT